MPATSSRKAAETPRMEPRGEPRVVEPVEPSAPAPTPLPINRYPVTLVLANDGARGDSEYVLELTEAQILRLLADSETPRYVRLPERYNSVIQGMHGEQIRSHETRWVRLTNIAEVHVHGGWEPPEDWEWSGVEG